MFNLNTEPVSKKNVAVNERTTATTAATITIKYKTAEKTLSSEATRSEKRKSSIVILEDNDIEEFQASQRAANTKKVIEVAIRRSQGWYHELFGQDINIAKVDKELTNKLLPHFFLKIRNTKKRSFGEDYEPLTLQSYRNDLRRYSKVQEKASRPNKAHPLDEQQIENLWESGAIGTKTPRQLLYLVLWNNIRMLGMRGGQEQLNCKIEDFKDIGTYYEYT